MDISSSGNRHDRRAAPASGGASDTAAGTAEAQALAAQAANNSLQLLLREDSHLREYGLTESASDPDRVAFPYAAALLRGDEVEDAGGDKQQQQQRRSSSLSAKQRADAALQDVERKLALVESLAVRLSRTRPEAVASHLLHLHGYELLGENSKQQQQQQDHGPDAGTAGDSEEDNAAPGGGTGTGTTTVMTLSAIRDRADRLERQADVLRGVAKRVEASLTRGYDRMSQSCQRLERVLLLSQTLKSILRLQFESNKLLNYDLDDSRDLSRAAASVAVLEDLLQQQPELRSSGIRVVDRMRPQIEATARQVREAAAAWLFQQQQQQQQTAPSSTPRLLQQPHQLGATLQVYYHLRELPQAVWRAVEEAHVHAETASRGLFNPVALANLAEQAKRSAKGESRLVPKRFKQMRSDAAQKWMRDVADAALQVRNLQLVLSRKTDPVTRRVFVDVVMDDASEFPPEYAALRHQHQRDSNNNSNNHSNGNYNASIFALFWERVCNSIASNLRATLSQDHGKYAPDVAALYPSVRAAALELIGRLAQESSGNGTMLDDASGAGGSASAAASGGGGGTGILGGSSLLDDDFLDWKATPATVAGGGDGNDEKKTSENPQVATSSSADVWTRRPDYAMDVYSSGGAGSQRFLAGGGAHHQSGVPMAAVFQCPEWKVLQGNAKTQGGLYPLQRAFLKECTDRLSAPVQYMFPENVTLDEDGVAIASGLPLLPSKFDVQRFDENIRQELSLADPREGGGDLTAVTMIAECVVSMIAQFCNRAKNAVSGAGEEHYLRDDWTMTEALNHDRKVAAILYTMAKNLRTAPDKTFIAPYRPATSPQHEEAAARCQAALVPALHDIDNMVKSEILNRLCRSINRRISRVLAKMHHGVYIEGSSTGGGIDEDSPAFVQKYLSDVFEAIGQNYLSRFPPEYASSMACRIAAFSIYAFVSNASLIRPLGENARLHITQDLADLELSLEQLVLKNGGTRSLSQIDNGKPYAELRAVRQMLFWTGLENENMSAQEVSKALLREVWMKDVRPSTVFHYLFSSSPTLLSSPHHAKRMRAEEYAMTLVKLDGSVEDGEDAAWMTTMSCCDSYQQRASSIAGGDKNKQLDGDARVPQILMLLGQELMRRRRR